MRHTKMKFCALVSLFVFFQSELAVRASDWPQWRGPDQTDVSKETGLLKDWPASGPKRLWVFDEAGVGYSGPSVVEGQLYTLGALEDVVHLFSIDANTGKKAWSVEIAGKLKNGWGDGPRGTPTVSGGRVYALSGTGTLVCADARDGKIQWKRTMTEFGGEVPGWGYAESVLVDGDRVICSPGGSKGTLVALDARTGELVWQSREFTDAPHYSSIVLAEANGIKQYVKLAEKHVAGLSAKDGSLLWTTGWPGRTAVIPTPIVEGGQVYVTAGYGAGCKLVKIGPSNQAVDVYSNRLMKNQHGGVIKVGENVYGYSDGVGWLCQNFQTGEEVWTERNKLGKGAVACAEGMLYCLEEDSGTLVLAEASPAGWKEHGRFVLDPQSKNRSSRGKVWTHPVISGGRLFLRDQEFVHCYDIQGR